MTWRRRRRHQQLHRFAQIQLFLFHPGVFVFCHHQKSTPRSFSRYEIKSFERSHCLIKSWRSTGPNNWTDGEFFSRKGNRIGKRVREKNGWIKSVVPHYLEVSQGPNTHKPHDKRHLLRKSVYNSLFNVWLRLPLSRIWALVSYIFVTKANWIKRHTKVATKLDSPQSTRTRQTLTHTHILQYLSLMVFLLHQTKPAESRAKCPPNPWTTKPTRPNQSG